MIVDNRNIDFSDKIVFGKNLKNQLKILYDFLIFKCFALYKINLALAKLFVVVFALVEIFDLKNYLLAALKLLNLNALKKFSFQF